MPRQLDLSISERVALARLASDVIGVTDGVTPTTGPSGRWQTTGSGQTVAGVLAVEDSQGRVDVELHLVAHWPPPTSLEEFGRQLRAQVRRAADDAGMGARLGAVSVAFDDVLVETESD